MPEGKRWQVHAAVLVIVALYAVLAAPALTLSFRASDEALYAWQASRISENPALFLDADVFLSPYVPVVPLLASPMVPMVGGLLAMRMVSLLFGALSIMLLFILGKRLFGGGAGLAASFLLAASPVFVMLSGMAFLNTAMVATSIAFAWAAHAYWKDGGVAPVGVMAILCVLVKPTLVFVFLLWAAVLFQKGRRGKAFRKDWLILGGTCIMGALLFAAGAGSQIALKADTGYLIAPEIDRGQWLGDFAANLALVQLGAAALVLFLLGLARAKREEKGFAVAWIAAFIPFAAVMGYAFSGIAAVWYASILLPPFLLLSGAGAAWMWEKGGFRRGAMTVILAAALVLPLWAPPTVLADYDRTRWESRYAFEDFPQTILEEGALFWVAGDEFVIRHVLLELERQAPGEKEVHRVKEEPGSLYCRGNTAVLVTASVLGEHGIEEGFRETWPRGAWLIGDTAARQLAESGFERLADTHFSGYRIAAFWKRCEEERGKTPP